MTKTLVEKIDKMIIRYDKLYEAGMDHEQGYDFAASMQDLLLDVHPHLIAVQAVVDAARVVVNDASLQRNDFDAALNPLEEALSALDGETNDEN